MLVCLISVPPKFNIIELNILWSIYVSRAEAGMILENEYIYPMHEKFRGRIYDDPESVTMKHLLHIFNNVTYLRPGIINAT